MTTDDEIVEAVALAIKSESSGGTPYEIFERMAKATLAVARPMIEAQMAERVKRLEEALQFYSAPQSWRRSLTGYSTMDFDSGKTAKAALEQKP